MNFISPHVLACSVAQSCLTLGHPHRLQPIRLLCPWDSPGEDTGAGYHFLLQEVCPRQTLNLHLLSLLQAGSLPLHHLGSTGPCLHRILRGAVFTHHSLPANQGLWEPLPKGGPGHPEPSLILPQSFGDHPTWLHSTGAETEVRERPPGF